MNETQREPPGRARRAVQKVEGHRATLKVLEDRRKLADYSEADTTTAELAAEVVALARSFIDTVAGRLAASPDSSS